MKIYECRLAALATSGKKSHCLPCSSHSIHQKIFKWLAKKSGLDKLALGFTFLPFIMYLHIIVFILETYKNLPTQNRGSPSPTTVPSH